MMKNAIYFVRIAAGTALVMVAAGAPSPFQNIQSLIAGAVLLCAGVLCGILLEGRQRRFFAALGVLACFAVILMKFLPALPFGYIQYFAAGFLVYFACTLAWPQAGPGCVDAIRSADSRDAAQD